MLGPFESWTADPSRAFGALVVVLFACGLVMRWIAREHLMNVITPNPFRDLERADTKERMDRIKEAWGPTGQRKAMLTLLLDLPFLVAYGSAISLMCSLGAVALEAADARPVALVWGVGAWLVLLSPAMDLVENSLLFRLLGRPFEGDWLPGKVAFAAKAKWMFALSGLAFLGVPGLFLYIVSHW